MKPRLFVVLILVIGLLVAMSSVAAAQAPSGDDRSGFPPVFAPQLTGPNVSSRSRRLIQRLSGRGGIRQPVRSRSRKLPWLVRWSPSASQG